MAKNEEKKGNDINRYWERLGILTCSIKDAANVIKLSFKAGHTVCLIGEAGIGKTQIWSQVGADLDYNVLFYYLAHLEREDIGGIPFPLEDKSAYRFLCESSIGEVINSSKPTIIVLDEWNRGEKPVMNAAFTLMEQRRFGSYVLPDHVYLGSAMNPSEGSYLVNEAEKDPAFRRRLCFVGVRADPAVWLEYALNRGKFNKLVTGFIQAQPQCLIDFEARDAGKVYANPAAWEKVSHTLNTMAQTGMTIDENSTTLRYMCAGQIGAAVTDLFLAWAQENSIAINPEDIIRSYKKKAQKKVRAIVDQGRHDTLMETCEAVALTLVANEVDPAECAESIGLFAADLPEDAAMAFFNKIGKHVQDLGKPQYQMGLSRALSKDENYRKALTKIHQSHERVEDDISNKKS